MSDEDADSGGALSVLKYRDFRLLWSGQALSLVGSQMQRTALLWHIYQLTGSKYALGLIGLARVVPLVTFAIVGGVTADALDRRRIMILSQAFLAVVAAAVGVWTLLGLRQVWPLYAVAALTAGGAAFDAPARQSLLPSLVPRRLLANAVSLNSLTSQLASIAGPALMGLIVATASVGYVYCVNAVSFAAVLVALLLMGPPPAAGERPRITPHAALEGLRFVLGSRLLTSLMLLDFLATFFSSATVLLPVYAEEILHTGARGYGILAAATPVGALAAAGVMSLLPPIRRQGVVVLWAVLAYGVATVAFGLSHTFLYCFLALAGTGAADTVSTVLRNTIRQLATPDHLRGRMHSVNMIFFQGGPQLGELEAGLVAGWKGTAFSVVTGGIACILAVAGTAIFAPWLRQYRHEEKDEG